MNDQTPFDKQNPSDDLRPQGFGEFPDTSIKQDFSSDNAPGNIENKQEYSSHDPMKEPGKGSFGRKPPNHKKIVLFSILGAFLLLLGVGAFIVNRISSSPSSYFDHIADQLTPVPTKDPALPTITMKPGEPTPSPTVNPYDVLAGQADTSMMKDIVNILLIGVDYAPERETWSGKHAYHADVMLILAINFKENTVDMISIPRDTYGKIPGVDGIYKLNASLDCGGGYPTNEGFAKVCETASWMLGGIPVQYYYAVDMPVVKGLVDAIGGIDYDIDIDFTMVGRSYTKGLQHLNGQGVLDYIRTRKQSEDTGDLNRINRQKKMLIALFQSMKDKDMITQIPSIVTSFEGQMHTNTSLAATASLALFAYNLPAENIRMHSMAGRTKSVFDWNFCLTDQKKRVELIKQVYGADVDQYSKYTYDYASWLSADMRSDLYLETVKPLISYVDAKIAEDDLIPTPSPTPSLTPTLTPSPTPDPATAPPSPTTDPATAPPSSTGPATTVLSAKYGTNGAVALLKAPETPTPSPTPQMRKYSPELRASYQVFLNNVEKLRTAQNNKDTTTMETLLQKTVIEAQATYIAQQFGYTKRLVWLLDYETTTNEVKVDFR